MFTEIKKEIAAKYSQHWELLDPAHRQSHFDMVFNNGLAISKRLNISIRPEEVLAVAYFHDLFTWSRSNHHFLSETFIRTTKCGIVLSLCDTPESIERVALACREHRASWTGSYSGDLSIVMSAADRGIPKTASELLNRSTLYTKTHNPEMDDTAVRNLAITHIKEKYGRNGYARIPEIHKRSYVSEYEILYKEIDLL
jgi:hypothetical protein